MKQPFSYQQAVRIAGHFKHILGKPFCDLPSSKIVCITPSPFDDILEHFFLKEYREGLPPEDILLFFDRKIFFTVLVIGRAGDHLLHKRIINYCKQTRHPFELSKILGSDGPAKEELKK
jgi:hypothetical protein